MAIDRNPEAVAAMLAANWEIASHGYRWIDYQDVGEEVEREHLQKAIAIHTRVTGDRPLGWYTGRISPNSRRLVVATLIAIGVTGVLWSFLFKPF